MSRFQCFIFLKKWLRGNQKWYMPAIKSGQILLDFHFNKIIKGPRPSFQSPLLSQKHVDMFVIQHTSTWPNFILTVLRVKRNKHERNFHYAVMSMMRSQIFKSVEFTKSQKSRYLKNETSLFLQIQNSLIMHQRLLYGKKQFCSGGKPLRVGGRIQKWLARNPTLHAIAKGLQNHKFDSQCHDQDAYAGITINQVKIPGFRVIVLNTVVRSMISKCLRFKHHSGRFQQQKMANLPRDEMSEEAPFTFCGNDMFRPFVVMFAKKWSRMGLSRPVFLTEPYTLRCITH